MLGVEQLHQALAAASIDLRKHAEMLRQENKDALYSAFENQQLRNFFSEFSFDSELTIGSFSLRQANCLKKDLVWDEDFKRGLKYSLLILGSGISGDMVTVDLLDFQAGILFQDYFWERPEEDPKEFLVKLNCSLGQFYLNSIQLPEYPIDAYEAAEFMNSPFTGYADI
ncbi:hypothetical protein [Hymenobacter rubidus]|uniref:hypothetical protein n=1 Tax=Hymenobacter rubidus TaxID=1441626 RepID=UPI00191DCA23|nr:hypothetical protein [Hymenobacter rubidus]